MKRKLLLFVLALNLLSSYVYPQPQGGIQATNPVQIMDLSLMPVLENTGLTSTDDSVSLQVLFLIKEKTMASKAIYLFGTTADSGNVLTAEVPFITQGNSVFLENKGKQKKIEGYHAKTVFKLSQAQSHAFKCLTVYVQKPNGQISNKLYFKKH